MSKDLNNHLSRATAGLLVRIDGRSRAGLQQQIYAAVRRGILSNVIKPGTRLPSSRALAEDLCVSRTALLAYEQLTAEGYHDAVDPAPSSRTKLDDPAGDHNCRLWSRNIRRRPGAPRWRCRPPGGGAGASRPFRAGARVDSFVATMVPAGESAAPTVTTANSTTTTPLVFLTCGRRSPACQVAATRTAVVLTSPALTGVRPCHLLLDPATGPAEEPGSRCLQRGPAPGRGRAGAGGR